MVTFDRLKIEEPFRVESQFHSVCARGHRTPLDVEQTRVVPRSYVGRERGWQMIHPIRLTNRKQSVSIGLLVHTVYAT